MENNFINDWSSYPNAEAAAEGRLRRQAAEGRLRRQAAEGRLRRRAAEGREALRCL